MKKGLVERTVVLLVGLCVLSLIFSTSASAYTHTKSKIKWKEYSQKAFEQAEKEGKPIFMLITAVWCYWCHVYEEKSLAEDSVAEYINKNYIPIFVDFDERKDIARRYPASGLPTTVIFAPDGTELISVPGYIPADKLVENLKKTVEYIKKDYKPLEKKKTKKTSRGIRIPEDKDFKSYVKGFVDMARSSYDSAYGGFGMREKEPYTQIFLRLLDYSTTVDDKEVLEMVINTIDHMAGLSQKIDKKGKRPGFDELVELRARERTDIQDVARLQTEDIIVGIYDSVEGGFFRYATRRDWTVPHYEKMLTDNAELILLFLKAYSVTGNEKYREIAQKSIEYVLNNLYDKDDGRFYGSQDADEVYYHFTAEERKKVPPPRVDRNTYTPSSSRMIITMFHASEILKDPEYSDIARRAVEFMLRELITDRGALSYYDYEDKKGHIDGNIEDNAWASLALLEAYRFTKDKSYLQSAIKIIDFTLANLYDKTDGGFFERNSKSEEFYRKGELFLDEKPMEENGIMSYVLYLAYRETGNKEYLRKAKETFGSFMNIQIPISPYFHAFATTQISG